MKPPEIIETERLRLRPPVMDDAIAIFAAYAQDDEVTRYLTWRPNKSVDDVREFLRCCGASWEQGRAFALAITGREDDRPIGMMELRPDQHRVELGYVLARPYWGLGLMTEAVRAVTAWALAQPDVHRVWAVCDVAHPASARVLEKAGMEREGLLRGWSIHPNLSATPRDCWCYARVREVG